MKIFLISCDFDLWQVVLDEDMDLKTNKGSQDEKAKKVHSLNVKAMNTLFCSSCEIEYTSVSRCTSAQEIWELLTVTHEDTSQVKKSKISLLTLQCKAFKDER